jgi:hypothetical protein
VIALPRGADAVVTSRHWGCSQLARPGGRGVGWQGAGAGARVRRAARPRGHARCRVHLSGRRPARVGGSSAPPVAAERFRAQWPVLRRIPDHRSVWCAAGGLGRGARASCGIETGTTTPQTPGTPWKASFARRFTVREPVFSACTAQPCARRCVDDVEPAACFPECARSSRHPPMPEVGAPSARRLRFSMYWTLSATSSPTQRHAEPAWGRWGSFPARRLELELGGGALLRRRCQKERSPMRGLGDNHGSTRTATEHCGGDPQAYEKRGAGDWCCAQKTPASGLRWCDGQVILTFGSAFGLSVKGPRVGTDATGLSVTGRARTRYATSRTCRGCRRVWCSSAAHGRAIGSRFWRVRPAEPKRVAKRWPTSCTPMGSPSSVQKSGSEAAGCPVQLNRGRERR